MDLKTALKDAEKALRNLDGVIAETVKDFEKELARELEAKALEHSHEVSKLEERIAELADVSEFYDAVYASESKGVLDTASPVKRLVFEKLAARWDNLTNAELDDLEALLDGKLTFI